MKVLFRFRIVNLGLHEMSSFYLDLGLQLFVLLTSLVLCLRKRLRMNERKLWKSV